MKKFKERSLPQMKTLETFVNSFERLSNLGIRVARISVAAGAFACSYVSLAARIDVPEDYPTIQAAIDHAVDHDEIVVQPNIYTENIRFNGKKITVRSTNPTMPSIREQTIIDGNNYRSAVTFSGRESNAAILGFTITNGYALNGGGINANGAQIIIAFNEIVGNTAVFSGGGIYRAKGVIQNNEVSLNEAAIGGGLSFSEGNIQNNLIKSNIANKHGGGIAYCKGNITNNTVYGNIARRGAGFIGCIGNLINNILWGNVPDQSTGSAVHLYSCIEGWKPHRMIGKKDGNIADDPKFVDPEHGDFNLQQSSPCIDAGKRINGLLIDLELRQRPIDGTHEKRGDGSDYDMGALEFGLLPFWHQHFLFGEKDTKLYFSLDGNSDDSAGSGLQATPTKVTEIEGRFGKAYAFDGIGKMVTEAVQLSLGETYAISAWVHMNNFTKDQTIISYAPSGVGGHVGFVLAFDPSPQLRLRFGASGVEPSFLDYQGPFPSDQWFHLAAMVSNGHRSIYLNGEKVAEDAYTNAHLDITAPIGIGVNTENGRSNFTGKLDELAIFNRSLNPEEVKSLSQDENNSGIPDFWEK